MIFGESHGPAIGVTLDGVPSGLELDFDLIRAEMARRAPKADGLSTARRETDEVRILSGVFEGRTTGTPLCAVIENADQHSQDYARGLPRPGHADYTGFVRYGGCADYRGGGHFSGRLTAPLVFAGAVAKQLLAARGVFVGAHILSVGGLWDEKFPPLDAEDGRKLFREIAAKEFPVISDAAGDRMRELILRVRSERDSVGGSIECCAVGVEPGFGAPDFGQNVEGILSQYLFAVPAVKAVAFGEGFGFASMRGSEANDPIVSENGKIRTETNHTGGVNGGITNGMPIVFTAALRPTPSIARPQRTVRLPGGEAAPLEIHGRHDPCIVHRAVPVVEAACALGVCEIIGI